MHLTLIVSSNNVHILAAVKYSNRLAARYYVQLFFNTLFSQ